MQKSKIRVFGFCQSSPSGKSHSITGPQVLFLFLFAGLFVSLPLECNVCGTHNLLIFVIR